MSREGGGVHVCIYRPLGLTSDTRGLSCPDIVTLLQLRVSGYEACEMVHLTMRAIIINE